MNIGIDIDNTITRVQEKLTQAAFNYAKELGKNIDYQVSSIKDVNNNGDVYKTRFKFSYEELKYF